MTTDANPTSPVVPAPRAADAGDTSANYRAMAQLEESIKLDPALRELVKLRASVLNGCAYCVDMHTTDARKNGETDRRLASVAAWHHAPFFTARERAALALTDAATLLHDGEGVSDEVWNEAKRHFEADELGQLVWAIAAINTWNRVAVPLLTTPPD